MTDLELSDTAREETSEEAKSRLAKLSEWDLSAVSQRTQARLRWSRSRRKIVEREYRRFLGLVILNPQKAYGMAGDVDQLWHDHVLHTEDYRDMCRDVVGGFVHHCPIPAKGKTQKREAESAYEGQTYPDLARYYRGRVSRVWPRRSEGEALAKCCGHGLET